VAQLSAAGAAERLQSVRETLPFLESQAIHFIRDAAAAGAKPVLLYGIGKDSAVLLHLARKAFAPAPLPFPLMHLDTGWAFAETIAHRERTAQAQGLELLVYTNEEGVRLGVNPFTHGSAAHTDLMKTQALGQALAKYGFDVLLGGGRRDDGALSAAQPVFSRRDAARGSDATRQPPEPWHLFNARLAPGQSLHVCPLSNWSELDVWEYVRRESIPVVPLYFARPRGLVSYEGRWITAEEPRLPPQLGAVQTRWARFPTLGCWPLSGAVDSRAQTLEALIDELLDAEGSS